MGFQSIHSDKSDREDVFNELLQSAVSESYVDNNGLSKLFNDHSGGVELYLRTGWNELIVNLEADLINKPFLDSINDDGHSIIFLIKNTLI